MLINYGLAPYFKELLTKTVRTSAYYVLSFDESLNIILQKEKMDLQVWHCCNNKNQVYMRYLGSHFLKHPNSKNLYALFLSLKDLLPERHLVQRFSSTS